jgi:hypothetical protein
LAFIDITKDAYLCKFIAILCDLTVSAGARNSMQLRKIHKTTLKSNLYISMNKFALGVVPLPHAVAIGFRQTPAPARVAAS